MTLWKWYVSYLMIEFSLFVCLFVVLSFNWNSSWATGTNNQMITFWSVHLLLLLFPLIIIVVVLVGYCCFPYLPNLYLYILDGYIVQSLFVYAIPFTIHVWKCKNDQQMLRIIVYHCWRFFVDQRRKETSN